MVYIAGDNSGPAYHDIFIPTQYFHQYNLLECKVCYTLDEGIATPADVVLFQRQYAPESLMFIRRAKALNRVTIALVDYNVWNIPPKSPANPVYRGLILERFNAILGEAHATVTSTPHLKSIISKYNSNCHIFRNLVDPIITTFLTPGRDNPEEIRIGWTGTPHHIEDIIHAEGFIRKISRLYKQVKWIFMGFAPPTINQLMPKERYELYGFVPVDAFYPAMASLDFDIGIAPLVDNDFNRGKTARKAQEYAVLQIPMVLAPTKTYEDWIHTETCLKPKWNSTDSWTEQLSYLIENPQERNRLAKNAYDYVIENHDIHKYIFGRAQTIYDIYNKVKGENRTWEEKPGEGDTPHSGQEGLN